MAHSAVSQPEDSARGLELRRLGRRALQLATVTATLLAGHAEGGRAAARLGLLLPPEEPEAQSIRHGAELAAELHEKATGQPATLVVRGRLGQWGDDGVEAGRMALDDGVDGLIAPPDGAASHLTLQVAGRTAVPVVSLCGDSSVTAAGIPWMVQVVPATRSEARVLLAHTGSTGTVHRWGCFVPAGRAGRESTLDLAFAAREIGVDLAAPWIVEAPLQDPAPLLRRLASDWPGGLLVWLEAEPAGQLIRSLRAAGCPARLAGPARLRSARFLAAAGQAAEGFLVAGPVFGPGEAGAANDFRARYRVRFGGEPDFMAFMAADAATSLLRLPSRVDARLPGGFPTAGLGEGPGGSLRFDGQGRRLVPLGAWEVRGGRFTAVDSGRP